jgi:hypothetical protein
MEEELNTLKKFAQFKTCKFPQAILLDNQDSECHHHDNSNE